MCRQPCRLQPNNQKWTVAAPCITVCHMPPTILQIGSINPNTPTGFNLQTSCDGSSIKGLNSAHSQCQIQSKAATGNKLLTTVSQHRSHVWAQRSKRHAAARLAGQFKQRQMDTHASQATTHNTHKSTWHACKAWQGLRPYQLTDAAASHHHHSCTKQHADKLLLRLLPPSLSLLLLPPEEEEEPCLGAGPDTHMPFSLSQWLPFLHSDMGRRVHGAPLGLQCSGGSLHWGQMSWGSAHSLQPPMGTGHTSGGLHSDTRFDLQASPGSLQLMGSASWLGAQGAYEPGSRQQASRAQCCAAGHVVGVLKHTLSPACSSREAHATRHWMVYQTTVCICRWYGQHDRRSMLS